MAFDFRGDNDKIMDEGVVFTFGVAEEASAALDELAGIGRGGEEEAHVKVGQVNAFVETADGHDAVEEAGPEVAENRFALSG